MVMMQADDYAFLAEDRPFLLDRDCDRVWATSVSSGVGESDGWSPHTSRQPRDRPSQFVGDVGNVAFWLGRASDSGDPRRRNSCPRLNSRVF